MGNNAPKPRRWRLLSVYGLTGAHASYEFPCRVSDRVAIVHTDGSWALWGWPAPQGTPIEGGKAEGRHRADAFRAAKPIARAALDALACRISRGELPTITHQESSNENG
jgi:hypothetical protein